MKQIIIFFAVSFLLQSCGLFKGSKCNDCPQWGKVEKTKTEASVRV